MPDLPRKAGASLPSVPRLSGRSPHPVSGSMGSKGSLAVQDLESREADGDAAGGEEHAGEVVEEHGEGFQSGVACSPRTIAESPTGSPGPCGCDSL